MKILNQIHDLTGDWSDGELVHDTMIEAGEMIVSLMKELKETQSYKADAERYKIIRNLYTKNSDSWTKQEKSIYRIISTEDTNNRRFDETIDQAMKEGK